MTKTHYFARKDEDGWYVCDRHGALLYESHATEGEVDAKLLALLHNRYPEADFCGLRDTLEEMTAMVNRGYPLNMVNAYLDANPPVIPPPLP